jgi:glycosyltransferase involved in cell wall biosynthesis
MFQNITVSIVIPALNEAESLPYVLPRIPAGLHEVIIVDGASTDGTIEVARALRPDVKIVYQDRPGKGAALRAGFEAATGDIVVHLDADGSTDPREIPAFVDALINGADYAKGSRFAGGGSSDDITPLRRLGNWSFVALANGLFGSRFSDITYGYNAVWRRHHRLLAPEIDGWAHEIVANIRAYRRGLKVVEVPSLESPRVAGEAKLRTFSAGWTILKAIFGEWLRPLPDTTPVWRPVASVSADAGMGEVAMPTMAATQTMVAAPTMVAIPIVPDFQHTGIPIRAYEDYATALFAEAD